MYSKVKGTNDVLMEDAKRLSSIEAFLKRVVSVYGFEEIRVPILSQNFPNLIHYIVNHAILYHYDLLRLRK